MAETSTIKQFFQEQKLVLIEELKPDRVFVVEGGELKRKMVLKIDPIEADRRPGKAKGLPRGEYLLEARRMEEAFKIMKDYRFFKLCLPGVYGMGRYGEEFDWLLMKHYEGTRFEWSESDEDQDILGGKALSESSAADIAMMVFDLTQVPPLKFTKKVETKNYPEAVAQLVEKCKTVSSLGIELKEIEQAAEEWLKFFEEKHATLYTIQNGDFYPRNFLQLEESIVLLDWEDAKITTVEEVIAYCTILMWNNPAWQQRFLKEVGYLLAINEEWLKHMLRYRALEQLVFWADESDKQITAANVAMSGYFHID